MKITKSELKKIQKWLTYGVEKYGIVTETKTGNLIFEDNEQHGPMMFHTHPISEKDGGYSPPSVHDIITFINMRKTTHTQFVISKRGIYKITFLCQVRAFTNLKKQLTELKKNNDPGLSHHKKWLSLMKKISPCLKIEFEKK